MMVGMQWGKGMGGRDVGVWRGGGGGAAELGGGRGPGSPSRWGHRLRTIGREQGSWETCRRRESGWVVGTPSARLRSRSGWECRGSEASRQECDGRCGKGARVGSAVGERELSWRLVWGSVRRKDAELLLWVRLCVC